MAKIKLGLRNLNAQNTSEKAGYIISRMENNPNFPDPVPSVAAVKALNEELINAIVEANSRATLKIVEREIIKEQMHEALRQLGYYVQSKSQDPVVLQSSGFELADTNNNPVRLEMTHNVKVMPLEGHSGCIRAKWKPVRGAKGYIIEMTTGNPNNADTMWKPYYSTRANLVIRGLKPLTYYYFRVKAFGTKGVGGISPATMGVAL